MAVLVVTLGDPFSINIEAVAIMLPTVSHRPLCVLGCHEQWQRQVSDLGIQPWVFDEVLKDFPETIADHTSFFIDSGGDGEDAKSLTAKQRGTIAKNALMLLKHLPEGLPLAVVTSPIDKAAMAAVDFGFPGHTEYFSSLTGSDSIMLLAGPRLKVALATNHLALRAVADNLTQEVLLNKIGLMISSLQRYFGIKNPKIAVCGLNPHCGDGGLFGDEEIKIISPAIQEAKRLYPGSEIVGPLPADTVFYFAASGKFDGVLAMYHDQGLGPLKSLHFDDGVNITGGLPYLRISPDHGPASDLFMQNCASLKSFQAAFTIAESYLAKVKESG
jgi:4-hydroxythreonine-4-phosphate dehydrogenase